MNDDTYVDHESTVRIKIEEDDDYIQSSRGGPRLFLEPGQWRIVPEAVWQALTDNGAKKELK